MSDMIKTFMAARVNRNGRGVQSDFAYPSNHLRFLCIDIPERNPYPARVAISPSGLRAQFTFPSIAEHIVATTKSRLPEIVKKHETAILTDWMKVQTRADPRRDDALKENELREQCRDFLSAFRQALDSGETSDINGRAWQGARDVLAGVAKARTQQGFTPTQTAMFVFSLKQPMFNVLRSDLGSDAQLFADESLTATMLLDQLGLFTTEVHQRSREEVISRQQQEMMELSTPVVKLWDGVLALPMIGTLDSGRTQVVMESLLQRIVETGAEIAILDITGVPTVDTLVAQHLIKTVTAARLMGADCIISGIRPQIAQTIVHLGVDLQDIITKASLADAFKLALSRKGLRVVRDAAPRS
jgi:rsbT co-antagonist protein RsbR